MLAVPALAQMPDLGPPPQFVEPALERAQLGQLLFYDPILSGNRNISCATCHNPKFGTGDGVSLSIGEGGINLGPDRKPDPANMPEQRVPRNSPGLWNLGASAFTVMFHDGRLETDAQQPNGIRTPLGAEMIQGFDSVLAAQAMFPVLSADEMAGHYSENEISAAVRQGLLSQPGGAWDRLARRVADIPEYRTAFDQVTGPGSDITFPQVANLIADFIRYEWRADNSAFDLAMRGQKQLSAKQSEGMGLFYGTAGCASCHSGWLQTDNRFYAIAMPQIGPGKAARFEDNNRDEGRMRVTGAPGDGYAFRTPSLRNVTLTAPYGHNGAYATLRDVIKHHLDPVASLRRYDISQAILPAFGGAVDDAVLGNEIDMNSIAAANSLAPTTLDPSQIDAIIAFLGALEDDTQRLGGPDKVPSGLAVDR